MLQRFSSLLCRGAMIILLGCLAHGASAQGFTQTKFPIVLVHGLFGFDQILGNPYFFQITPALREGGARVFTVQIAAANNNDVRGEQLLQQVRQVLAITGATKVNLIGHSQGGPTARYVLGVRPDLVASLTTVGSPHTGSAVADVAAGLPGPLVNVATRIAQGLAGLIDLLSGGGFDQDVNAALSALTTSGSAAFNRRFPTGLPTTSCGNGPAVVNGVHVYSWSGTGVLTNILDITDAPLGLTALAFLGEANDGLVGRCSSHFGTVIRDDYFQNHLDEVNQVLGLTSPFTVNPVTLFRQQANRLRNAGL
jgi:triacylglycerol lipase